MALVHMYMCVCVYIYIYIYIYIHTNIISIYPSIYLSIYLYIYRERGTCLDSIRTHAILLLKQSLQRKKRKKRKEHPSLCQVSAC
jgi:hypothetical protein